MAQPSGFQACVPPAVLFVQRMKKVPHLLVVGKREEEEGAVAIRTLGSEGQRVMSLSDAITMLRAEATPPDLKSED